MKKLLVLLQKKTLSISLILFLSSFVVTGCGSKKPIVLPDGRQIFLLESFRSQDQEKIVTRILRRDSETKELVAFSGEEYLELDGAYVLSAGLMLEIADLLIKVDPELAKKIIDANK